MPITNQNILYLAEIEFCEINFGWSTFAEPRSFIQLTKAFHSILGEVINMADPDAKVSDFFPQNVSEL